MYFLDTGFSDAILQSNNTAVCKFNFTNELNLTTYANVSVYLNGALSSSNNSINLTLGEYYYTPSIDATYLTPHDNLTCYGYAWDAYTTASFNITQQIINLVPSVPTAIYCDGTNGCNITVTANTTNVQCYGSTHLDNNQDYFYYVGAFFEGNVTTSESIEAVLNISFCSPITELSFYPDLDNYNITSKTLTQYNVTPDKQTTCTYVATWSANCPLNITVRLDTNFTSQHMLWVNDIEINTTDATVIKTGVSDSWEFNVTFDYKNASRGVDFSLLFNYEGDS
jgi:hypothetical protein